MPTTMKLIAKQTLTGNATVITFSNIPSTGYSDLMLVHSARLTETLSVAWAFVAINPNGSSANGSSIELFGTGSSAGSGTGSRVHGGFATPNNNTAATFGSSEIYIPNYAGSTNKSFSTTGLSENNAASTLIDVAASLWSSTAAITSLSLVVVQDSATIFASGSSFFLYGITKA